ncbi:hypothetical protein [Asanoa iriomotensis]|uniref:Integral membrane protein n=1 Tax=Asanoa iriomotensis TaxID=234613 RepID=A0ABQ4BYM8_9ACTN|nr:hypothetical protein [Asanoa iriomotensis]GIF55639.1 hypothetical protein Air01nite_17340 [Asanoa iriomotensis]
MRIDGRGAVAIVCALAAAVLWGLDMALWQPMAEQRADLAFLSAENNTYWARDLRFGAAVAIGLAVSLAGRGGGLSRWVAPATAAGWIGVDLLVDRAGAHGETAAALLAVAGGVVALAVTAFVLRRAGDDAPRRRTLVIGASIAAAVAPLAAGMESPTDTETALTPAAATLGVILTALSIALAWTAAPDRSRGRFVVAGVVAAGAAVALVLSRALAPGTRLTPVMLLGALLLAGVALLTGDLPRAPLPWLQQLPKLLVLLVLYPALVMFTLLFTVFAVPVASWFTALAGSVPVNAADSDTLYALIGVIAGGTIGWLLLVLDRAYVSPPDAKRPVEEVTTAAR